MAKYKVTFDQRVTKRSKWAPLGRSSTMEQDSLFAAAIELIRAEDTARVTASVGLYTIPDHNRVAEARIRYDRLYKLQSRRHNAHVHLVG